MLSLSPLLTFGFAKGKASVRTMRRPPSPQATPFHSYEMYRKICDTDYIPTHIDRAKAKREEEHYALECFKLFGMNEMWSGGVPE